MKDDPSEPSPSKKPLSFRVRSETAERLERHASEVGETQTALVERYVEEGLRMDGHPLIRFRDGVGGRRPGLVGTRLDVWQVIETVRQNERSVEDAADYLGLPVEHVRACLRYYAKAAACAKIMGARALENFDHGVARQDRIVGSSPGGSNRSSRPRRRRSHAAPATPVATSTTSMAAAAPASATSPGL
jgi:uncharacterized protein (DUF433 family)